MITVTGLGQSETTEVGPRRSMTAAVVVARPAVGHGRARRVWKMWLLPGTSRRFGVRLAGIRRLNLACRAGYFDGDFAPGLGASTCGLRKVELTGVRSSYRPPASWPRGCRAACCPCP